MSVVRSLLYGVCLVASVSTSAAALEPGQTAAILAGAIEPAALPTDALVSSELYAAHRTRMEPGLTDSATS